VLTHDLETNGIVYCDVGLDLTAVPFEEVPLLPLFSRMLMETGTSTKDRVALSRTIGAKTGGLGVSFQVSPRSGGAPHYQVGDPDDVTALFLVRGKATLERTPELFGLMKEVLSDSNLSDRQRAVEMLKETVARMQGAMARNGHAYCNQRIGAHLSLPNYVNELTSGVAYYSTVNELLLQAQSDDEMTGWPSLHRRLLAIRTALLSGRQGSLVNLTSDGASLATLNETHLPGFLASLPGTVGGVVKPRWGGGARLDSSGGAEGYAVSTQVNYVGMGAQLYDQGEPVSGSTAVIGSFLRTGYLWEKVRVMGGAYGAMCSFGRSSGSLSMLSYRDPNLSDTLEVYGAAGKALIEASHEITDEDLELAIIGTIGSMDSPSSMQGKGFMSLQRWLADEPAAARQTFRDQVINTSRSDLCAFGERLDQRLGAGAPTLKVIVGSQAAFDSSQVPGLVVKPGF